MTYNIYPLVARAILPLLVLSLVSNLAILISPLFMMQVLDRVIPSGNIATLALLGVLALAALVVQALVEASRDLALGRLARWSEQEGTALALAPNAAEPNQTIRQVAGLSQFLGGPAAIAALGAPWIPIFALVIWMLHPAFLLLVLAMSGIFLMSRAFSNAFGRVAQDNVKGLMALEQATLREANDTARDVGIATLVQNLRLRFSEVQRKRLEQVDQGELPRLLHSTVSSLVRNAGQISALALGAWLVTADQLSAGGMIAGSIITSKTYAAIESFLVSFPVIREAKREYATLAALPIGQEGARPVVDEPSGDLRVDNLIFPRGGGAPPRLDRVSFDLTNLGSPSAPARRFTA